MECADADRDANESDLAYATIAAICLPHRRQDRSSNSQRWSAHIENLTAVIDSGRYADGSLIGLPFGSKARIILVYLTTQALYASTPEIELGPSMYAWLRAMDGRDRGGMTYRLFAEQARRIAAMTFEVEIATAATTLRLSGRGVAALVAPNPRADPRPLYQRPRHEAEFPQRVVLERSFWQAVPGLRCAIRLSALRAIANNSGAIDLYVWLSYRLPRLQRAQMVEWPALTAMFGTGYRHARQMKPGFLNALRLAQGVYPEAQVEVLATGLRLHPGPPPIGDDHWAIPER